MKNIWKLRLVTTAVSFLFAFFSPITSAAIITLNAIEDSIILDGSNINNQFPGILASELDTSGNGSIWLSVLKFDLSSLASMDVNSATFELTSTFNHSSTAFSHEVFSSSDDGWAEDAVTGVNRPQEATLTFLDSTNISGISQTYSWDVLTGVVGADGLAGINDFLTLFLRPELSQAGSGGFGAHFYDREAAAQFPVLLIDADLISTPPVSVTEPTSLILLVFGLVGFFFKKRKNSLIDG